MILTSLCCRLLRCPQSAWKKSQNLYSESPGDIRKEYPLHVLDIGVHAAGKGENQGDADDADRTRQRRSVWSGFFGLQVIEAQRKSSQKGHGGFPHVFMHGLFGQSAVRLKGFESERIFPSRRFTIRVAYCSASSGLWVTITTRRSFATS